MNRWSRVQELFLRASALPETEIDAFVQSLEPNEDPLVIDQVWRLLRASGKASQRLQSAIEKVASDLTRSGALGRMTNPELNIKPDSMLGVYRIERELARGGMSTVYLAHRSDREFEQNVAIKVVCHDLSNPELEHRLLAERQILARLSHPNIARLLDGGTTPDGWPYFVMEVIDGLPIDRYCDQNRLTLRERIRLFQKVCKAVHFAHRNLVIHRDIKPSNVLVNTDGEPKLLDFGIAKVLDPAFSVEDFATMNRLGTPGYTSPEQILGNLITTASDIYNLGILLYHLLTGCRPHEFRDSTPIREIESAVLHTPSILPSLAAIDEANAASRKEHPESLRRRLRGDLDNILQTTLRQEPERRYESVRHLADDLDRYLDGYPVQARTDSLLYRGKKFIRRHWIGLATTAGTLLLSILFVFALVRQQGITELQRDRAEEVSQMLISMFHLGGPNPSRGNSLTARELLDLGQAQIDLLESQPDTQALLRNTLGSLYEELGLFRNAAALYQLAFRQRLEVLGEADPLVSETLYSLARATARSGAPGQAIPYFQQALDIRRSYLGEDHVDVIASLNGLALALHESGKYEAASEQYQIALERSERLSGEGYSQTSKILGNLALLRFDQAEFEQAELLFRKALESYQDLDRSKNMVAELIDGLAQTLRALGKYDEAEARAQEGLELRRSLFGDNHPEVARSIAHLAQIVIARSPEEALPMSLEALRQRQDSLGEKNAETAESLAILAANRAALNHLDEAARLYRESIEIYTYTLGSHHQFTAKPIAELGLQLAAHGDCAEALPLLETAARTLPQKDHRLKPVLSTLSQCADL
jgi:serine/threonine-protein kinase